MGSVWRIGWVDAFHPKGRGFDSCSSSHKGTLGKSFTTIACGASAWNSGTVSVLCRECLWVVVNLKRPCRNGLNEWILTHYHLLRYDSRIFFKCNAILTCYFIRSISCVLVFVQIGTVKDSAVEFYSNRIPKRQRKKHIIDELLEDADFRK